MTRMGGNANLVLIWTCLPAQILWAMYFPEDNLFITETIFRVSKCLLSTVSDIPHYLPLLRSLKLCAFPSLGHTCLCSLQAFANAVILCGITTAFLIFFFLNHNNDKKPFCNPSRPTSSITSSMRISILIPTKNALCSPLPPGLFPLLQHLSMHHPVLTHVSCSLLALCPSLYPVGQILERPSRWPLPAVHQQISHFTTLVLSVFIYRNVTTIQRHLPGSCKDYTYCKLFIKEKHPKFKTQTNAKIYI